MATDRMGWILIHSEQEYGVGSGNSYDTPQQELDAEYKSGLLWQWRLPKPISVGGPYTLLFAWDGKVFGEATADVTHAVDEPGYNFSFRLHDYRRRQPVPLADLALGDRLHHHRSLIRLDDDILKGYRQLAGA